MGTDLNNIGSVLQAQGKLSEALEYYRQAHAVFEKSLGPQHPNTRIVRGNLALAQAQQNGWNPDPKHKPNQRGAIVLNCLKDTCAPLEPGDWLKTYGTTPIRNTDHLIELVQTTNPSQSIPLTLIRNTKTLTLQVPGGRLGIEIQ